MTDPVTADNVYLKPLTVESIEEILKMSSSRSIGKHRIDAVLPTMEKAIAQQPSGGGSCPME